MLTYLVNLVAFQLKTLFLLFGVRTFRRIKRWYLHFIISQEEWLHFLMAKFTIKLKKRLWKKKFQKPRSSRKFITMEKNSSLPFFHAYIPKENTVLPTDHRALPTAPATRLFWSGLLSLLAFHRGENSSLKKPLSLIFTEYICLGQQ